MYFLAIILVEYNLPPKGYCPREIPDYHTGIDIFEYLPMPLVQQKLATLSDDQLMRYSRHIMLPKVDIDGQEKVWNSKVLIIGIGGLGCAVAQYLTVSGVGFLTLVDDDEVDKTNLQRQVLFQENTVGSKKVTAAINTLTSLNSEVTIEYKDYRLPVDELNELVSDHDVVIDCSDNLTTRNQLNESCFANKTALISGAAIRMEGQVSTFSMQPGTPCYSCVSHMFQEQNLTCSEAGIMSPVVGLVGCIQATECLKLLTELGLSLTNKLLLIDAITMEFKQFKISPSPHCRVCASKSQN